MQISSGTALRTWGTRLRIKGAVAAAGLRQPGTLSYLVPALLTGVGVQTWFAPGRFIAAGDISPFVRDNSFFELGTVWQHTLSGAGGPSFDMARLPELATIGFMDFLGGGEQLAQRFFLTLIAMAVVLSVTFLVRSFDGPAWLAGIAGLFAFFNPYLLVSFPNALPAWALACMAALAGIVIRVGKGQRIPISSFVLASMACCYLVLNPALFAVTVGWVFGVVVVTALLVDASGRTKLRRFLQIAIPWTLVANLWLIAAWSTWFLESKGSFTGQTDVRAWSWTHARNSFPNVLSLNGHWGWEDAKYFPYSSALSSFPWNIIRFCIPLLALAAPFVTSGRRRRLAWMGVGAAATLILLAKGLHEPFASLNLFLYQHVPGMWLLREPMSKLGAILVLLFSVLVFFTMCRAWDYARTRTDVKAQLLVGGIAAAVLLGLMYPYPMWTGAVIPDSRPVLPSAHVDIPAPWMRIASMLNRHESRGKVLLLPLDDYYQIPTKWGYYGADRIPKNLLQSPTLQQFPGGYFSDGEPFQTMLGDAQALLVDGDVDGATRLMHALGVSHVIVRRDIDRSFPRRTFAAVKPLEDTLNEADGIKRVVRTSVASVYEVEDGELFDVASSAVNVGEAMPSDQLSSLVASIPRDSAAFEAAQSDSVVVPLGENATTFDATWTRVHVSARLAARQLLAFVTRDDARHQLTLRRAPIVRVDGRISDVGLVGRRSFADEPLAIQLDGQAIALEGGMGLVEAGHSQGVEVFGPVESFVDPPVLSVLHDCNQSDGRSMEEVGIRASSLPAEPAPAVGLSADSHSACVYARTASFQRNVPYKVQLSYRTLQGRSARLCLWQEGPDNCAEVPSLENVRDWNEFSAVVLPEKATEDIRLFLYADGDSGQTTQTQYRDIQLAPLTSLGRVRVQGLHSPDIMDLTALADHEVTVQWPGLRGRLRPLSDVRDCNAKDALNPAQAGLAAQPLDSSGRSVRLRAEQHAACVRSSLSDFAPGAVYKLKMEYRTLSGRPARVCVWQERVGSCASLPPLEESRSWRGLTSTFRAREGTTGLTLLVYADGGGDEKTVTEYRHISLRPVPPASVVLRDAAEPTIDPPDLAWSRLGPASFRVTLGPREAASTLIMNDAYSGKWGADMVSADDVELEHQLVNGYANGWEVGPGEEITLEIRYGPDVWYRVAILISFTAVVIALIALMSGVLKRSGVLGRGEALRTLVSRATRKVSR